jgi:RHS repeat-associated protein
VAGARTYFHYNDEGLAGEYNGTGNELRTYGYQPGSPWSTNPLFIQVGGEYYWYQNDHLGTPQKMISANGTVVWSARYDSFGLATVGVETVKNNLRFPGQYFDYETGLHYNWHRFYDPETGRYVSADPIGLDGGMNLYSYAYSDPINWIDPTGLVVHFEGSAEDQALMKSWFDKLEECAKCDEELKKRLDYVKSELYHYYIRFRPGGTAGGFNRPNEVRLDPTLKDPNYKGEEYKAAKSKTDKRRVGYFRGPDVIAHELLGHGYDWANGDKYDNQGTAIDLANKIRECLGNIQPQRRK